MSLPRTTPGTSSAPSRARPARHLLLNIVVAVLGILVLALAYAFISRTILRPPVQAQQASGRGVIQLDVLNGCGASGAASTITAYLRSRGFDVVEMRNYKTFDVPESLVIDRTGSREDAERVASALGVKGENIVVQISPDYFVDVSLVIGKDYRSLKPLQ